MTCLSFDAFDFEDAAAALKLSPSELDIWIAESGDALIAEPRGESRKIRGETMAQFALASPMIQAGLYPEDAARIARQMIIRYSRLGVSSAIGPRELEADFAGFVLAVNLDRRRAKLVPCSDEGPGTDKADFAFDPAKSIREVFRRLEAT